MVRVFDFLLEGYSESCEEMHKTQQEEEAAAEKARAVEIKAKAVAAATAFAKATNIETCKHSQDKTESLRHHNYQFQSINWEIRKENQSPSQLKAINQINVQYQNITPIQTQSSVRSQRRSRRSNKSKADQAEIDLKWSEYYSSLSQNDQVTHWSSTAQPKNQTNQISYWNNTNSQSTKYHHTQSCNYNKTTQNSQNIQYQPAKWTDYDPAYGNHYPQCPIMNQQRREEQFLKEGSAHQVTHSSGCAYCTTVTKSPWYQSYVNYLMVCNQQFLQLFGHYNPLLPSPTPVIQNSQFNNRLYSNTYTNNSTIYNPQSNNSLFSTPQSSHQPYNYNSQYYNYQQQLRQQHQQSQLHQINSNNQYQQQQLKLQQYKEQQAKLQQYQEQQSHLQQYQEQHKQLQQYQEQQHHSPSSSLYNCPSSNQSSTNTLYNIGTFDYRNFNDIATTRQTAASLETAEPSGRRNSF